MLEIEVELWREPQAKASYWALSSGLGASQLSSLWLEVSDQASSQVKLQIKLQLQTRLVPRLALQLENGLWHWLAFDAAPS